MPWPHLLLVTLSGYFFYSRSFFTRYTAHRLDSQRLIFHSMLWGIFFLGISLFIRFILYACFGSSLCDSIYNQIAAFIPHHTPILYTSISSVLLMLAFLLVTNLFLKSKHEKYLIKAIERGDSNLDKKLLFSLTEVSFLEFLLEENIVYIAIVKRIDSGNSTRDIVLYPIYEGFKTNGQSVITKSYNENDENLEIVIPRNKILSINDMAEEYNYSSNSSPI